MQFVPLRRQAAHRRALISLAPGVHCCLTGSAPDPRQPLEASKRTLQRRKVSHGSVRKQRRMRHAHRQQHSRVHRCATLGMWRSRIVNINLAPGLVRARVELGEFKLARKRARRSIRSWTPLSPDRELFSSRSWSWRKCFQGDYLACWRAGSRAPFVSAPP